MLRANSDPWLTIEQLLESEELETGSIIEVDHGNYSHYVVYIGGHNHNCYHFGPEGENHAQAMNLMNSVQGLHLIEPLEDILSGGLKGRIDRNKTMRAKSKGLTARSARDIERLAHAVANKTASYNLRTHNCEHHATALVYGEGARDLNTQQGWSDQVDAAVNYFATTAAVIVATVTGGSLIKSHRNRRN
jgi:hypothetical protein